MLFGEVNLFYTFTMGTIEVCFDMDIVKWKDPNENRGLDLATTQDKWAQVSRVTQNACVLNKSS